MAYTKSSFSRKQDLEEFQAPVELKARQRWLTKQELAVQRVAEWSAYNEKKESSHRRFINDRNAYYRRSGMPVYGEDKSCWEQGREDARVEYEASRRQGLNDQILKEAEKRVVVYGGSRPQFQLTRKQFAVLVAIFSLACLSVDLFAAEDTIARAAHCHRRTVSSCIKLLLSFGILVKTKQGSWRTRETNHYQIRYDRLRELLGIEEVKKKSMGEICEEMNRAAKQGKPYSIPSRRYGWPGASIMLVGMRGYIRSRCGKISPNTALTRDFTHYIHLKALKGQLAADLDFGDLQTGQILAVSGTLNHGGGRFFITKKRKQNYHDPNQQAFDKFTAWLF